MTFYSFPSSNLPHSKHREVVASADRIASAAAIVIYFALAAFLLPRSEYLHALGGGALIFAAVILASLWLPRGWLPGMSVLVVGFIAFAVLVMPTLPAMGGTVPRATPIGFIGVQAAILLWATLQWPYTLPPRTHIPLRDALWFAVIAAAVISLVATVPIVLGFAFNPTTPKSILLVYPAYFIGFLAAAVIYWSLQRLTHLAVGKYLIGILGGTCIYGAVAPVVFLFEHEPIQWPLMLALASICGGFVGPAVSLDSKGT